MLRSLNILQQTLQNLKKEHRVSILIKNLTPLLFSIPPEQFFQRIELFQAALSLPQHILKECDIVLKFIDASVELLNDGAVLVAFNFAS